jgi:hypothetical protein
MPQKQGPVKFSLRPINRATDAPVFGPVVGLIELATYGEKGAGSGFTICSNTIAVVVDIAEPEK